MKTTLGQRNYELRELNRVLRSDNRQLRVALEELRQTIPCPTCGKCPHCQGTGIREYAPSAFGRCTCREPQP